MPLPVFMQPTWMSWNKPFLKGLVFSQRSPLPRRLHRQQSQSGQRDMQRRGEPKHQPQRGWADAENCSRCVHCRSPLPASREPPGSERNNTSPVDALKGGSEQRYDTCCSWQLLQQQPPHAQYYIKAPKSPIIWGELIHEQIGCSCVRIWDFGHTGVAAVLVWWWEPARVPAMLRSGWGVWTTSPPSPVPPPPRLHCCSAVRVAACQGTHPTPRSVS